MYEDAIFELDAKRKKINNLVTLLVLIFIFSTALVLFTFFRNAAFFEGSILAELIGHVKSTLTSFDLLAVFYVGLFGGLFFVFVPMEAYFMQSLRSNDPYSVLGIFLLGIVISYSFDYLIGMKLSKLSKKLISPKRFYSVKSYINRFGNTAVFIANGVPFLPSQQVTFILGVFRYNKVRCFVLTMGGQVFKALILLGFFLLFFN